MNTIQGKIDVIFDIPEEFKKDPELAYDYVRGIAEKLSELKIIKECNQPMIIAEVQETEDDIPFLDDKDYYIDYYDAIFPE